MEIDKLTEGADIVRYSERTKQDQPESYQTGNLWEPDQKEDQDNDGKRMSWII